jgi:hypothetical protein
VGGVSGVGRVEVESAGRVLLAGGWHGFLVFRGRPTLEFLEGLYAGHLVSFYDLARVQTHDEEVFCFLEQLTCEDEDCIGRISHLRGCGFSKWMDIIGENLTSVAWAWEAMTRSLAAGWTTSISRMIVAASEVTNSRPRWLIMSLFLPVCC